MGDDGHRGAPREPHRAEREADSAPTGSATAGPPSAGAPLSPRARRQPRLDRMALLVGWLAAVALALTAWLAVNDPALEGQAVLARRTGELADAVRLEWGRWLQAPSPGWVTLVSHDVGAPRDEPEGVEWWREALPGGTAFDALLAEAGLRERDGAFDEAVELLRDALALDVEPPRRAEGRLRLIQLAARAGAPAVVSAQLGLALDELDGRELRDGTSYRLLCLLTAVPALPPSETDVRVAQLVDDWRERRFAWRAPPAQLTFDADGRPVLAHDPWRAALRARLLDAVDALPDEARARMDGVLGREPGDPARLRALEAPIWGQRLRELVLRSVMLARPERASAGAYDDVWPGPGPDMWSVLPLDLPPPAPPGLWIAGRERGLTDRLALVSGAALQRAFSTHLRQAGLLRDGFVFDLDGEPREPGVALRGGVTLGLGKQGTIRHPDPDSLMAGVRGRVLALRVGLVVAALLCAFAGTALASALRREQRLTRLRSAFVASVSHELRTPVSSVLLMAENLDDGRVGPERAPRYHALIRREATRLQRLVHDVLDVSRLERGLPPRLRVEPVDVPLFVGALGDELRGLVEAEGGTLALRVGALPTSARWDTEALRRALLNLADNALRHGRGEDGATQLSLAVEADGERVGFTLADGGPGLGPRPAALFEPFARGARHDQAPGTGLGLAIVRAIAEGHGGVLRALPADRGACLRLSVPVVAEGAPTESIPEGPS